MRSLVQRINAFGVVVITEKPCISQPVAIFSAKPERRFCVKKKRFQHGTDCRVLKQA
jgi:hypothetical protein